MLNERDKWDKIARSFDETRRKPWKVCLDFIEELSEDSTVLDLGCGNGRHMIHASKRCKFVIGLDFSMEMLKIARKNAEENGIKNFDLILADIRYLPLKDESIDNILFVASIHNIEGRKNRILALKEVRRILKINGRALITTWYKWQRRFRLHFLKEIFLRKEKEFGDMYVRWKKDDINVDRFYHLYSKKELIRDLKEAGLRIVDVRKVRISDKKSYDNVIAVVEKG